MHWHKINTAKAVSDIFTESNGQPLLIFKHSHRCSISTMALSRLERNWTKESDTRFKTYLVNVVEERPVSNELSEQTEIRHESPQVLILQNGRCVYEASHYDIRMEDIEKAIQR